VSAVIVDLRSQMIKVVLSDDLGAGTATQPLRLSDFRFKLNPSFLESSAGKLPATRALLKCLSRGRAGRTILRPEIARLSHEVFAALEELSFSAKHVTGPGGNPLFRAFGLTLSNQPDRLWLVAREILRAEHPNREGAWPSELLLAIILGDTWKNNNEIDPTKIVLSAAGVPVKAWLIEHDERLYNAWGRETYEPLFDQEYLRRTLRAMWKLSTSVFAHSAFSYETLASEMRDPDVERVRRAVRRLSIICTSPFRNKHGRNPFWVGKDHWRWAVETTSGNSYAYYGITALRKRHLSALESPEGERG